MSDGDAENLAAIRARTEKQVCPDDGTCHHECVGGCFRVVYCAPLTSPQTPDGVWPTGCVEVHGQLESWRL